MTDIVAVGARFFAGYGAVPAGLLGERGDRQPRRQLHDSRTGEECAPSSSTTLVNGLARTAARTSRGRGGGVGTSRGRGGGGGRSRGGGGRGRAGGGGGGWGLAGGGVAGWGLAEGGVAGSG